MTDTRMEQMVGNLLRTGVATAAAVVLAGGVWYVAASGGAIANYRHFQGGATAMPWKTGLTGPLRIIQLGLLLLIATPVARVVFSLVAFALERDRVYVTITVIVLAILAYSLAVA